MTLLNFLLLTDVTYAKFLTITSMMLVITTERTGCITSQYIYIWVYCHMQNKNNEMYTICDINHFVLHVIALVCPHTRKNNSSTQDAIQHPFVIEILKLNFNEYIIFLMHISMTLYYCYNVQVHFGSMNCCVVEY